MSGWGSVFLAFRLSPSFRNAIKPQARRGTLSKGAVELRARKAGDVEQQLIHKTKTAEYLQQFFGQEIDLTLCV